MVVGDEHGGRPAVVVAAPEHKEPEAEPNAQTTESVIMPVEPGRDVFAEKAEGGPKSISSERVIEPLRKEEAVHTSASAGGAADEKKEEEKPEGVPLPKNEGAESTGKEKLVEEVQAKEAEAKVKVPAGVQEKLAQVKENVAEKVENIKEQIVEAKEKAKDKAKAESEEERVRMELYGDEKKKA